MEKKIFITKGKLAADDNVLKAKREALKQKLMNGDKVVLKKDGNVMGGKGEDSSITVPKGVLAADDNVLKAKREALRKNLMNGKRVIITKDGNVMGGKGEGASTVIPPGKLALYQWYDRDPELLDMEKAAMHKCFPEFTLDKLDDGRLYWMGTLTPGIYETKFSIRKSYTVMAVYNDNHPEQAMGSSVRVYPISPDENDLVRDCGFHPHHLIRDSKNNRYLCTNEAGDVKVGSTVTTAASVLAWAVKWLSCYELVLTGEMSQEEFDHGGM